MAEEPKKDPPEDISSILSDLDAILTGMGGIPPPPPPPPAAPPPKIDLSIVPKAEPVKAEAPKAAAPKTEPPKVVEPPKPAAPAAAPAVRSEAPATAELPADTPKDQIRRVAYVHTLACAEAKNGFAAFLGSAARTISKKPLFLREVLSHEVTNSSDPKAIIEKAKQVKAVAILAVIEGWPPAKTDELSEACERAGMLFRLVATADMQKKSTAVDIIVDMMLLSGEA